MKSEMATAIEVNRALGSTNNMRDQALTTFLSRLNRGAEFPLDSIRSLFLQDRHAFMAAHFGSLAATMESEFSKALFECHSTDELAFSVGTVLWDDDHLEEAVEFFRVGARGNNPWRQLHLAEALEWTNSWEEALTLSEQLRTIEFQGRGFAAGLAGTIRFERLHENDDNVIALLSEAARYSGQFAISLADLRASRREFGAARDLLELELHTGEPRVYRKLADVLLEGFADSSRADELYRKGVLLDDWYSAYNLAVMLIDQNRNAEAKELLAWALSHGGDEDVTTLLQEISA